MKNEKLFELDVQTGNRTVQKIDLVISYKDVWQLAKLWKCLYLLFIVYGLIEGLGNQHVAINALSAE